MLRCMPITNDSIPLTKYHPHPFNELEFCAANTISERPNIKKDMEKNIANRI